MLRRIRTAMPKIIRNVAQLDWGFFSETETRLHLQVLDEHAPSYKVWLEQKNKRCFIDSKQHLAIPPKVLNPLREAIEVYRTMVERHWVNMKIRLGQFTMTVDPSQALAIVTLYPNEHPPTQRKITHQVPMGYAEPEYLKYYRLDPSMSALQLGTRLDEADRYDIYLPDLIWGRMPGRASTDW